MGTEKSWLSGYQATFYHGVIYGNPLPTDFKDDCLASVKPLCWIGHDLWQIAWLPDGSDDNPLFIDRFGIIFLRDNASPFAKIRYKGISLWLRPCST
jgi:hypothetical protein